MFNTHVFEDGAALWKALFQVQAQIRGLEKTRRNPHLGNWYADLDTVLATVKPVLIEAGLLLLQGTDPTEAGVYVVSRIVHVETGQWVETGVPLPFEYSSGTKKDPTPRQTPQNAGSAITYGRRYSLCALLGITQTDDDGHNASSPASRRREPVSTPMVDDEFAKAIKSAPSIRALHEAAAKYRGGTKNVVANRALWKARAGEIKDEWLRLLAACQNRDEVAALPFDMVKHETDAGFVTKAKISRIEAIEGLTVSSPDESPL